MDIGAPKNTVYSALTGICLYCLPLLEKMMFCQWKVKAYSLPWWGISSADIESLSRAPPSSYKADLSRVGLGPENHHYSPAVSMSFSCPTE